MAWCRPGDKPLSEPIIVSLLTHICVIQPQWVKCRSFHQIYVILSSVFPVSLPSYECQKVLFDDKLTLVEVMTWYQQATSHYLITWWPMSMSPSGISLSHNEMMCCVRPLNWVTPYVLHMKMNSMTVIDIVEINILIFWCICWYWKPANKYGYLFIGHILLCKTLLLYSYRYIAIIIDSVIFMSISFTNKIFDGSLFKIWEFKFDFYYFLVKYT